MKVNIGFIFADGDLRSIRAALGKGGKATRKECRYFIAREINRAIEAAPTPKRVAPKRERKLCRLGDHPIDARTLAAGGEVCYECAIRSETEEQEIARHRAERERIAHTMKVSMARPSSSDAAVRS